MPPPIRSKTAAARWLDWIESNPARRAARRTSELGDRLRTRSDGWHDFDSSHRSNRNIPLTHTHTIRIHTNHRRRGLLNCCQPSCCCRLVASWASSSSLIHRRRLSEPLLPSLWRDGVVQVPERALHGGEPRRDLLGDGDPGQVHVRDGRRGGLQGEAGWKGPQASKQASQQARPMLCFWGMARQASAR